MGFAQGSDRRDSEGLGRKLTAFVKRCIVVSKLPSAFWKKRCLPLNRVDYAENKFRTYFEVSPSFMSQHFLPAFLALLWNDNRKGNDLIQ